LRRQDPALLPFFSMTSALGPLAIDTETALICPGRLAPPLTCVSMAWGVARDLVASEVVWVGEDDAWFEVSKLFKANVLLVGLNIAYDCAVLGAEYPSMLPDIFRAYEEDRICDIGLRQKLIDIAQGKFRGFTNSVTAVRTTHEYSLAALVERHFGEKLDKSTHRLNFGALREVPPEQWPEGAEKYAVEDAEWTLRVWEAQEPHRRLLQDQFRQARGAWGLHLISCWGIRTNAEHIRAFEKTTTAALQEAVKICQQEGLVRPDGKRDTKKARARMLEVMEVLDASPKRTDAFIDLRRRRDSGETLTPKDLKNLEDPLFGVCVDAEACEATADDVLIAYASVTSLSTVVTAHIPHLWNGTKAPIQPRFEPLVETGRTSCKGHEDASPLYGFQMQNIRRLPGIRECFEPRPGCVFVDADYSGLELHTWAQTCLNLLKKSKLAKALNEKKDPHLLLASYLLEMDYEYCVQRYEAGDEHVAEARQFAKIGNFGFQGGMQSETFRAWARAQYKVKFSVEQAAAIREAWLRTWPEAEEYFTWVKYACQEGGVATVTQFQSLRVRGLIPFTVTANTFFQGLGADLTKDALFQVQKECYVDSHSPLYGARMVNYVHDEFLLEAEEGEKARAVADRLVGVMEEVGARWLPEVPPRAAVALMRFWSKKAKTVRNKSGQLIPWEDRGLKG
jgi:hypothetical protein